MCPTGATAGTTQKRRRCAADLDAALDRLSLIELAIEARVLEQSELPAIDGLEEAVRLECVRALHQLLSVPRDSFHRGTCAWSGRHIDWGRKALADAADGRGALNRESGETREFEINELPLRLAAPPIRSIPLDIAHTIAHWLDFQNSDEDVLTALRFIDNYGEQDKWRIEMERNSAVNDGLECGWKEDFERWLRGLGGRSEREEYFGASRKGCAPSCCSARTSTAGSKGANASSRGVCAESSRTVSPRIPYSARFGVLDLYWLARLLRAELSSVGVVTYEGASWICVARGKARQDGETPGGDRRSRRPSRSCARCSTTRAI